VLAIAVPTSACLAQGSEAAELAYDGSEHGSAAWAVSGEKISSAKAEAATASARASSFLAFTMPPA
jgi:hypothetical protein